MQMLLNCCLCFPSGMKHPLPLSPSRHRADVLGKWTVGVSLTLLLVFTSCLKVEMLVGYTRAAQASPTLHTLMPLGGGQLPIITCNRGRPCMIPFCFHSCSCFSFFCIISNDTLRNLQVEEIIGRFLQRHLSSWLSVSLSCRSLSQCLWGLYLQHSA